MNMTYPFREREINLVFGGVRVATSLVFYVVSCVLLFVCTFFCILAMALSVLFSIYEFYYPYGIFRPSFTIFFIYFEIYKLIRKTYLNSLLKKEISTQRQYNSSIVKIFSVLIFKVMPQ